MTATNWAKNKIQDYVYGAVSFTPPTSYFLGLSTTTISASGSNSSEPVGAGYARVEIANDKSHFTYASSGCLVNSTTLAFGPSSGSWGTITDVALYSALTSGSIWFFTSLTTPKIVQTDTTVSFSASAITFTQT
jgi:hypothetical protein